MGPHLRIPSLFRTKLFFGPFQLYFTRMVSFFKCYQYYQIVTKLFLALRPLVPFRQVRNVQVFPVKPAPFCELFGGLGSTNKSAISLFSLLLSFSPRRSFISSVFAFTSISLENLAETVFSLLLFYQTTMDPRHSFLPRNDAADELARRRALLVPSAIYCGLYSLISRIHSCLFSEWKRREKTEQLIRFLMFFFFSYRFLKLQT